MHRHAERRKNISFTGFGCAVWKNYILSAKSFRRGESKCRHFRLWWETFAGKADENLFLAEFLQPIPQLGIEAHKKYYAQLRHCCQTFPFNFDYILNPVIDTPYHMGFAPEYPLHNMYSSNRVCSITSSSTTHYCYLIYLGFDEQKRKMDTYFPCHPNSLIWKFNVKHIN